MPGAATDPAAGRPLSVIAPEGVRAILLDVEGTATPLDFVHATLFPFARGRVHAYLEEHPEDTREDVARLAEEHAADLASGATPPPAGDTPGAVTAYVHWLMDQDRKSTALKSLQGKLWESGYRTGGLRGEVYPDAPRAFERWRRRGLRLAIFSSGSVLAQRLIFGYSTAGDLTPHIEAYFDTTTGPKRDASSYRRIAQSLGLPSPAVLFLSDVIAELDAAREGGMRTGLCVRDGPAPDSRHPVLHTFDDVFAP